MNESKLAGANYIVNFFNHINQLNSEYSKYQNYLLEIDAKYSGNIEALSDLEKDYISNLVQICRYYVSIVYIQYKSIYSVVDKLKESEKIEDLYNKINNTYLIEREQLKEFILEINKALVNDVMKDLLVSSKEIVGEIYGTRN